MSIASHKPQKAKRAAVKKTTKELRSKSSQFDTAHTSVGVRELRQSASKILDQVKEGATIEITEHGIPVARLVPITKSPYEEYLESGRIIPARNPHHVFKVPKGKISKGRPLSELLIEERRAARF